MTGPAPATPPSLGAAPGGEARLPEPLHLQAADGVALGGWQWRSPQRASDGASPVVIVSCATSVRCRYYARFAADLHAHGFDVITFDYRGIGESRPAALRGFDASWSDWGRLDFEAVLDHAARAFPDRPIDVVAHSFGGCAAGLAPSAHRIRRLVTVGAQFAYWRDYAPAERWRMFAKWHVAMPLLAACLGYVPAKRLGWMEDTPRGVALDWAAMAPRFEHRPSGRRTASGPPPGFATAKADILAISLTDDPFGTIPAIERLLSYFSASHRTHLRLAPADIGVEDIGHFAFFHSRFQPTLWPLAHAWLRDGALPVTTPGTLVSRTPAG